MPKYYDRYCDNCGEKYHGRGKKYCGTWCSTKAQKADEGPTEDIVTNTKSGGLTISKTFKDRIVTVEDLKAAVDFDEDVFEIVRGSHNKWEVGAKHPETGRIIVEPLFQVKLNFKPIESLVDSRAVLERYLERAHNHSPDSYKTIHRSDKRVEQNYLYEINITDHHVGSLIYGLETGGSNRNTAIAVDEFMWAVEQLMDDVSHLKIDRILFPLGNDLFHADRLAGDGSGGVTTRGTMVDVDSRRKKMIRSVETMCVTAIDYLRTKAPVDVVIVPGNHDEDTVFTLGEYLYAWYRNCDDVDIDNSDTIRKYYKYGNVLLGFTHGRHETTKRLPMLMPTECPEKWAATKYREWHIGDKHTKNRRDVISVDEEMGMRIRIFPSLAGQDAWHARKGYKSGRAAEAFLWNAEKGFKALFSANITK